MTQLQPVNGATITPFAASTSLPAAGFAISPVFDNTGTGMTALDLALALTSVTPAAGTTIAVYLVPAIDGTNYATPPGSSAVQPPESLYVGCYTFTGAATTVAVIQDIKVDKYKYYIVAQNTSAVGITIASSFGQTKTYSMV